MWGCIFVFCEELWGCIFVFCEEVGRGRLERERARDGESKGQVRREGDKQKDFVRNYTPRVSQREEEQKLNPTPWGSIQKQ
jgi:hypothetical protein